MERGLGRKLHEAPSLEGSTMAEITTENRSSVLSNTDPAKYNSHELDVFYSDEFQDVTSKPENPVKKAVEYLTESCRHDEHHTTVFNGVNPQFHAERQLTLAGHHLIAGVDSAVLSITTQLDECVIDKLEQLKERAQDGTRVRVASGPFVWELKPYGVKPHFRYVLEGPAIAVKIRKTTEYTNVIQVDLRSVFLWSVGPEQAVDAVRRFVSNLGLTIPRKPVDQKRDPSAPLIEVSRIDLCADFEGDIFDGTELVSGRFITRARKRTTHRVAVKETADLVTIDMVNQLKKLALSVVPGGSAADFRAGVLRSLGATGARTTGEGHQEHTRTQEFRSGKIFTGYSFGSSDLVARIYRKDIQLENGNCHWFTSIWTDCGYKGGPVWRVEFQLRTEAIKTFVCEGVASRCWRHVWSSLHGLWRQLTGRKLVNGLVRGWLTLRDDNGDKNTSRWPISKVWQMVRDVDFFGSHRVVRVTEKLKRQVTTPAMIQSATGRAMAERLGPQLIGLAEAYVSAKIIETGRAPADENEAYNLIVGAVQMAINNDQRSREILNNIQCKIDRAATESTFRKLTER